MNKKKRKFLYNLLSIILLLIIWEIFALIINADFVLPGVLDTFHVFFKLLIKFDFWVNVTLSIGRIVLGFMLGTIFAVILTPLTILSNFAHSFVSLIMGIIKSTPVASFIMVIWIMTGSGSVPTIIAVLIVMPIIWQNLYDGYYAIDKHLLELAAVYDFSREKKLKYIYTPSLMKYFLPAVVTSVGLAWKSGIAAEIIAYTSNSIGKEIFDARAILEGQRLFAWTVVVIILSICFERLIKYLSNRFTNSLQTVKECYDN